MRLINEFAKSYVTGHATMPLQADADKNEYSGCNFDTGGTMSVDKDKDVSNGFGNAVVDAIDRNTGKQLKVSKFKILVAIIHCKKSYLSKTTLVTKLPLIFLTAF